MMIFSKKFAGRWVASKKGKVVDSSKKLPALLKRIEKREDRRQIFFDKVPPSAFIGTSHAF